MSDLIERAPFDLLIAKTRAVGGLLLSLWPGASRDASSLAVTQKGDGSLVSAADMRSNELLTEALGSLFPGDFIFSEEVSSDPAQVRSARRTWIIDPLDGTAAFLEGRDDFSVLVGLAVDHKPAAGIMFFPARDEMITAIVGEGAFRDGAPVRVSSAATARPNRVYMRKCPRVLPELASPAMDSGLALALVASGELDGAIIRMLTHREWDIAAPMAVLREAGARVSDETGQEVPLGVGGIGFSYLVVSNGLVHDQLLDVVAQISA
jgi:myo-inositol-1(or 4)-monophosphatase